MDIRNEYSKYGIKNFYQFNKENYKNPHINSINKSLKWIISKIDIKKYLDLSCGNGEVTDFLIKNGYNKSTGCDPYFMDIFIKNFDKKCYNFSFEEISKKGLPESFDTIICSYALHICPKSFFNTLLYQLSIKCKYLVIISPSKYPIINDYFELINQNIIDRTHTKIYKSII